jgi:hypothetical protein
MFLQLGKPERKTSICRNAYTKYSHEKPRSFATASRTGETAREPSVAQDDILIGA